MRLKVDASCDSCINMTCRIDLSTVFTSKQFEGYFRVIDGRGKKRSKEVHYRRLLD